MQTSPSSVLGHLDHSLLAPTVTLAELEEGARDAVHFGVAALCILPYFVRRARSLLKDSPVKTCTVIAFPHGGAATRAKLAETEIALDEGAQELDVVVNVSRVLSAQWQLVEAEIEQLTRLTHQARASIKWIFETCALDDTQIVRLCAICGDLGVDWVKTSTGFGSAGASPQRVELLRRSSPPAVQVKASGGIRTLAEVETYLALGASRIGTSRTRDIASQLAVRAR